MQTHLPAKLLETPDGKEADRILRSCVHCGFCTATCPTFLITGNELDSPRGRIYLIKEVLETGKATQITRTHLDRCLSCQACETTCPSDVNYHSLLNIGREVIAEASPEKLGKKLKRVFLLGILGSGNAFSFLVKLGQTFRQFLPKSLTSQLPGKSLFAVTDLDPRKNNRKVVLLNGCVQSSLSPDTSLASNVVLNRLGIEALHISSESCCGAMTFHSNQQEKGLNKAKLLIDQIIKELDEGAEAVISTASGCGNFIKDYSSIFKKDNEYQAKVSRVVDAVSDISEFLVQEDLGKLKPSAGQQLAFHSPCTLQHGQQLGGVTESLLEQLGFVLPEIKNSHLCCGSAGTYSLFQPEMAKELGQNKIQSLQETGCENIATANIGCQCHLAGVSKKNIRHWIEFVAQSNTSV
ncbi:MAG: glycolate oxidase subunit GlcF [Gammaproteobacteria bacterium]|jgi:glycolate oxidase iron-sulfur subunit|nr:glycolate oxidase subunit GlcF [Gammaproteobacteria bacterium]